MIGPDDHLERIQDDTFQVLRLVPSLGLVPILIEDEGDIENEVERKIGAIDDSQTGKSGLVIVVLQPTVEDAEENLPGPFLSVTQEVQIIENKVINRGESGTGIRCSTAGLRVLQALQLHTQNPFTWHARKNPLQPFRIAKKGMLSYVVTLNLRLGLAAAPKPAAVAADLTGNLLTLACATAGARIHYTTDGSYPRPTGGSSNLYTSPVQFTGADAGKTIRAAAFVQGMNPGDCLQFTLSEEP